MVNTTADLIANMTASGPSLRESIIDATGHDPVDVPEFAWSNDLPCDRCTVADSTAVVFATMEGDTAERLCWHCFSDELYGDVS